jgi:ABC-type antimicrobial peptide transport system permease subunit
MSCVVSADYFAALGVAPTAGHVPAREEIATGSKLAAISRTEAVQSYGTERAALGQRLRLKRIGRPVDWVTVVAVVPEIGAGLFGISASIYNIQQQPSAHSASMVVRLRDTRQFRVAEISRAFVDGEAGISVSDVSSARAIVERARGATRGRLLFLGSVAVLAFVLAVVGVYGLTSYTTELRARELGIRIALGASRSRLAYVVVNDLWWMAVVGITVGIVASGRLVNFLDAFVRTPATKGAFVTLPLLPTFASAVALFGIMLLGTAVPLRRVLRLDVMRTIQGEAGS